MNYGALFRSALVVSRNMIIEHVWDQSFGTVGNLVEVYVYQLRNKIDGGRAAKLVQVVQGFGYSICEQEPETQFG